MVESAMIRFLIVAMDQMIMGQMCACSDQLFSTPQLYRAFLCFSTHCFDVTVLVKSYCSVLQQFCADVFGQQAL